MDLIFIIATISFYYILFMAFMCVDVDYIFLQKCVNF